MMEQWDENSDKVTKISSDVQKAIALLKMIALREKRIAVTGNAEFATLLVEEYYEIVKELITAIMSVDGWKTVSHELLIGYLAHFYTEFTGAEISMLDQLRRIRNDIAYRGVMVEKEYMQRNKAEISRTIIKLKNIVNRKIKEKDKKFIGGDSL